MFFLFKFQVMSTDKSEAGVAAPLQNSAASDHLYCEDGDSIMSQQDITSTNNATHVKHRPLGK